MSVVVRAAIDANLIITDKNLAPRVPSHPKRGILIFDCMYTVYMHTFPNNKVYIGITANDPQKRWRKGLGYKPQPLVWRAIQKYGWENISHEILFENLSKEEACKKEIELIKEHNSTNSEFGYNNSSGGDASHKGSKLNEEQKKRLSEAHKNPSPEIRKKYSECQIGRVHSEKTRKKMSQTHMGHKVSKETREKLSKSLTGKTLSPETKKKVSDGLKKYYSTTGEKPFNYGKHLSDEAKQKLREKMTGRSITDEHKKKISENSAVKRSVLCVETGQIFSSAAEAERKTGINSSCIIGVCRKNKHRKTAGGYHWQYNDICEAKERLERGDFDDPLSTQSVP